MNHVCEFCGQVANVVASDPEEARLFARENCDCGGAARWRAIRDAHKGVDELLVQGDGVTLPQETVNRVKTLCEWIVDGAMAGASMKLNWGMALTAKRNGQGELVLTLKQSQQRQVTV